MGGRAPVTSVVREDDLQVAERLTYLVINLAKTENADTESVIENELANALLAVARRIREREGGMS